VNRKEAKNSQFDMEEIVITNHGRKEWQAVVLENENLSINVLPELGGKMTKLVNKKTGTQFLKEPESADGELTPPSMGFDFKPPYAFGFDECFPTVAPTHYPFNERVIQWPDHGELWTQEWEFELVDKTRIVLKATGVNLLYEFQKEMTLEGNEVKINYSVKNNSYRPFDYIWAAHPLLEINEEDEILLPDTIDEVSVYYSSKENVAEGIKVAWPFLQGDDTDFATIQARNRNLAMKLFAENVETGRAGLYRKRHDETILFGFDTEKVPHLGLWLCYGGWPENAESGSYTVALEPTTASFDKLSEAIDKGQNRSIEPGEVHSWDMSVEMLIGKAEI
jgi:galactose mutarotase-like enzyme